MKIRRFFGIPIVLAITTLQCTIQTAEVSRWQQRAQRITIARDDWGIAHVRGPTDADAVFGMIYAQAEDDFNRVEVNYLNAMGRLAETEGGGEIYRDLRMKLFIDPDTLREQYAASPDWLKSLMDAWADGLNYYLYEHPAVHPKVIARFEPWMALSFTEGSIGGDIERVDLDSLEVFYGGGVATEMTATEPSMITDQSGSNGIAIAPSNTQNGRALFLINPHTSFYFRSELQMTSDEGLDADGAVTWGQFFVYQGFNDRVGWMHTSSGVDNIDEYLETVVRRNDSLYYRDGGELRPIVSKTITVPFATDSGMAQRTFTVYYTQHGPVVRSQGDKWVSVALMQAPIKALTQSYTRTKARSYAEFRQTMELHTNSSNNTVYADADGNIAYFHANFIPRRDPRFNWRQPVDGSDPATDWGDPLSIDQTPGAFNPPNGWIQNTNNAPWTVAGLYSPKKEDFPAYVETGGENARGIHAIRLLEGKHDFTLQSLLDAAFDSYLTAFEALMPALFAAYDRLPASNPLKAELSEQIRVLRDWDLRWGKESVATSLAVFWGTELMRNNRRAMYRSRTSLEDYVKTPAAQQQMLETLATVSEQLETDFGTWRTPWGDINRFQRINDNIDPSFDDAQPNIPVPFTSSEWGSLASFSARSYPNTKKWYGSSGNSFVAVVEFGDSVHARAVTAGGESGDPSSPHFDDEAERYASGNLREVYFYPDELKGHVEREYRPGGR